MLIKLKKDIRYYKKLLKYFFTILLLSSTTLKAANCTVSEAKINFGTITSLEPRTTNGQIAIICSNMTNDISYTLLLMNPDKNLTIENNYNNEKIFFEIFTSPNYLKPWSDEEVIKGIIKNINGNGKVVVPIYAKIKSYNSKRKPAPGEYRARSNIINIKLIY